MANTDDIV